MKQVDGNGAAEGRMRLEVLAGEFRVCKVGGGGMTGYGGYRTPEGFGDLRMSGEGDVLTGLWFAGTRGEGAEEGAEREVPVFRETRRWLDEYFAGREPGWRPKWRMEGLTEFRREVVGAMLAIPFGETVTYGEIAAGIARGRGTGRMSAQAVGGAVGWNPVCIIVPCHRVVGAGGALTGYGGGMENKRALLAHERVGSVSF